MVSKNQIALDEGRITQDQFDDMACYKLSRYGNWEDLDIERDYSKWGIVKWYPVVKFCTKDGRGIVSPRGFVKYMMDQCGITDYDLDDIVDHFYEGDDCIKFTYRSYGWTWIYDHDLLKDKMDTMIHYTFGGWCGDLSPLSQYVTGYDEEYD